MTRISPKNPGPVGTGQQTGKEVFSRHGVSPSRSNAATDLHKGDDVDQDEKAHHHTLGFGPGQAASGKLMRRLWKTYKSMVACNKGLPLSFTVNDTLTLTATTYQDLGLGITIEVPYDDTEILLFLNVDVNRSTPSANTDSFVMTFSINGTDYTAERYWRPGHTTSPARTTHTLMAKLVLSKGTWTFIPRGKSNVAGPTFLINKYDSTIATQFFNWWTP